MDLNELFVFARVVQTGSFTSAARALDMTKSSVSRKITDLEDRIGARLLQRTTRSLNLTDVGRAYYEHCARIIAEVEEANLAVSQMQATPRGLLRISIPLAFGLLGPVLDEYLARYPDVKLEVVATDRAVDLVDEGFDLALRAGKLADSALIARPLATIRRVVVASPQYLKRRGTPKQPEELTGHECLVFSVSSAPTEWNLSIKTKTVTVKVPARLAVNDFDILLQAAKRGLGIASLPDFLVRRDLATGKLKQVLKDWCASEVTVHAVYPSTRHLSPKVIALIDLLRERLPKAANPE